MPEVTVRDAQPSDAAAIAEVWTRAMPHLVRTAARAESDLRQGTTLTRRHWVGLVDGEVAGTATGRDHRNGRVSVTVEVHPDRISRGVGGALLRTATAAFPDADRLTSVCNGDAISLAFAVRHGFLPVIENRIVRVDPRTVSRVDEPPTGADGVPLRPVSLLEVPDLQLLLDAHHASADVDPSDQPQRYTLEEFRADWWNNPDNVPELSWALLDESGPAPVVAGFTSVQVDRARARAWSGITATRPGCSRHDLAHWLNARMLGSVAFAGVTEACAGDDLSDTAMTAVRDALGYRPDGTTVRVARRVLR